MTQLINTPAHRAARNAASIALADTGPGVASICLYTAQGGDLLALRKLQKPCAQLTALPDGRIALLQAGDDDLVLADGVATWGAWVDAAGTPISQGHVTDAQGRIGPPRQRNPAPARAGAFCADGGRGYPAVRRGHRALGRSANRVKHSTP